MERNTINSVQKEMLKNFIIDHPELQTGLFTNEFTFKKAQQLWQHITINLNSVPNGAQKDWKQWRKTWQDIKKHAKAKAVAAKKHACGTGGGEPSKPLSAIDMEIIEIINPTQIDGLPIVETPINFNFDKAKITSPTSTLSEANQQLRVLLLKNLIIFFKENYIIPTTIAIDATNAIPSTTIAIGAEEIIEDNPQQSSSNDDHDYLPKTPKSTKPNKTTRLKNSLELSHNLLSSVDKRNSVLELYYAEKIEYMKAKRAYLKEKGDRDEKCVTALMEIKDILNKQFNDS
ncbi:hypothetical protein FQR65_LT16353 [Abscondita terminalis]|nr:hypothetical protein FQR65_LT16353 [Abscondita terminalis]